MNIFKVFYKVPELFFSFFWWAFVILIYSSFLWFFNEPINGLTYWMPVFYLLTIYLGYLVSGRHKNKRLTAEVKKSYNITLYALIGFIPVFFLFLDRARFGRELSTIRQDNLDNVLRSGTMVDTLYQVLFPLTIGAFIVANYNRLKYRYIVNVICILSILAFIPISGGRVNIIVFGVLYLAIYSYKNYEKLTKSIIKSLLNFFGIFLAGSVAMAIYTIARIGADSSNIINTYTSYQFVNKGAIRSLLQLPFGIGIFLTLFIYTFYDYTGGCIYYLSIFLDNANQVDERLYGLYNFRVFDRSTGRNWQFLHDKIDLLYEKYDLNYNLWATSIRDLYADFGFIGAFIFVFIIAFIMFYAKKYIEHSYSAQVVFFISLAFFMFSPFHSIFYESQPLGLAFLVGVCVLLIKGRHSAKP